MSRLGKQFNIAGPAFVAKVCTKLVLLHITHTLEQYSNSPHAKFHAFTSTQAYPLRAVRLRLRTIEYRDGQARPPDPDHLERPEPAKFHERVSLIIKPIL